MFDITSRQAKLLDFLSKTEEYLPAKQYADYLNVSERTIFNDLDKLEIFCKKYNLVIDKKQNQGIKLIGDTSSSNGFIQKVITNHKAKERDALSSLERQILIAKWLLINSQTVTYQSLSLDLYISSSSIIKDINRIRSFMDEELQLVSNAKGTRVNGNEIAIQRTIKRFAYYLIEKELNNNSLSTFAHILEPLFDKKIIKAVYDAVIEFLSVMENSISEQYIKSLFISILILTERSYRGFHLTKLPEIQLEGAEYLTNYPLAIEMCSKISSELQFEFTELEHHFLSNQLFAHRIQVKINNKQVEKLISEDIKDMIRGVSRAIEIDLKEDDRLFDSLIYHVFPMIYRLKSAINVYNPLLNEIKNNYGVLFRIIWYSMEKLEKKYDIKLTDDDVAFITIHFQVAIERKNQMSQILVVCQSGLVTSDLIIHRIKNLLPSNIQFRLIAKPLLKSEDLSKVDFIISSVQLEEQTCPVVYVSPLVRDSDLKKIYAYYLKYSSKNRKQEDVVLTPHLISKYINSRYMFINEEVKSKEDCLNKMIQRLEEDQIVKSSFKQSVYERERLGNTIVQGWAAIPHAMSTMANETKISIMTTKQPINWNNETYVSFVILLAVAEEDLNQVRCLLTHLYKIIINSDRLESGQSFKAMTIPEDLIAILLCKDKIQ
ncbi:BglG family transcription antiterminator [Cytobacillus praedii]|uniref:BglG family transcription antiterminator n=1 Tax=Cytobacillus praedii TaxID=1742358 RepID=UPI00070FD958|nr:BglG family transcription antiterminator [Cytobacillus praedii]